jgi:hypothetical protein
MLISVAAPQHDARPQVRSGRRLDLAAISRQLRNVSTVPAAPRKARNRVAGNRVPVFLEGN